MSNMFEVVDIFDGEYTILRHEDGCDLCRAREIPIAFKIPVSEAYKLAERDKANRFDMHGPTNSAVLLFKVEGDVVCTKGKHIMRMPIRWTTRAISFNDAQKQFQDRLRLEYGIDCKLDNFNIHVVPTPYS